MAEIKKLFGNYKKSINPPYSGGDFFVLGGTFLVLLIAFVAVISIPGQYQNQNSYTSPSHAAGSFLEVFNGDPASPQNFTQMNQNNWDIQVHSRNPDSWVTLPEIAAQHAHDCAPPPASHMNSTYEGSVFNCKNHLMTAIDGSAGYALISLVPNHTVDCTTSCTIQWEMSTEVMSGRDWIDLWITPWAENITMPFGDDGADLQGPPKNGISIDTGNGQHAPVLNIIENGQNVFTNFFHGVNWPSMNDNIAAGTNQAATRQTFKFTITPTSVKFERLASATGQYILFWQYNTGDIAGDGRALPTLKVTNRDVVQFDQHSYTPFKDGAGVAATWHWDAIQFSPATPFTMIKADRRSVDGNGGVVKFNSPAPANSWIRFSAICKPRINGGPGLTKQVTKNHPEHFGSYFSPVPAGFTEANITFTNDDWYSGPCHARDFAIWSLTESTGTNPTATTAPNQPTNTPVPAATNTPTPTQAPVGNATLGVTPSTQSVNVGQTVTVNVGVNSGTTGINAVQTTVSYPANILQRTGITYGSSFPIQAVETLGNGTVTMARGTTGSVTGNANVATITFTALASGNATIGLSSSQVFTSQGNQNIFSTSTNGTVTVVAPTPTPTRTPTPTPTPVKLGDINNDGTVNLLDFSILLVDFNTSNSRSDINNNGIVNLQDLSILLSNWTQ